ncbi:MAG: hypothetical protein R3B48_04655 [Kofleriaceae bacterium]
MLPCSARAARRHRLACGAAALALTLAGPGCQAPTPRPTLDPSLVWVSAEAKVRTDTVGEGPFASQATFVLVDAENRAAEPAMITLGGTFRDEANAVVGTLRAESLWVPAGGRRMFALVDRDRVPRPTARGAQILVSGARVAARPPIMHLEQERTYEDYGKIVAQARLVNDADRPGRAMVFAAFYDAQHRPMARPFSVVPIAAQSDVPLQLVGPEGSASGVMFLGDLVY